MKRSQVVVITGASAGVGRATAIEFARSGACVGLIARGADGLEGPRRDVEAAGGRALVLPADVADAAAVEAAAGQIEDAFGPIDAWVNNAMCSVFSPVAEMTADEYARVTSVTVLAIAAQAVLPGFADWYLGRHGYASQQRPEREAPGRPDNLFSPVPGDHGARRLHVRREGPKHPVLGGQAPCGHRPVRCRCGVCHLVFASGSPVRGTVTAVPLEPPWNRLAFNDVILSRG